MLLIVTVIAQRCRLPAEVIWSLLNKKSITILIHHNKRKILTSENVPTANNVYTE